MSLSVQSVRMPRCSFQPILTGKNHLPCYASLQAGMGSIPSGIYPFNSDLAGMPLSLLMLFTVVYLVFVITLQLDLIIYQSFITSVSPTEPTFQLTGIASFVVMPTKIAYSIF